jgi:hypothetical protein
MRHLPLPFLLNETACLPLKAPFYLSAFRLVCPFPGFRIGVEPADFGLTRHDISQSWRPPDFSRLNDFLKNFMARFGPRKTDANTRNMVSNRLVQLFLGENRLQRPSEDVNISIKVFPENLSSRKKQPTPPQWFPDT